MSQAIRRFGRFRLAGAALVVAILSLGSSMPTAYADQYCGQRSSAYPVGGTHCYSTASYSNPDTIGVQYTITRGWLSVEQAYANPRSGSPPAHLNSELWFAWDASHWIEAGFRTEGDTGQNLFVADVDGAWENILYEPGADYAIGTNITDFWQITRSTSPGRFDISWNTWPNRPTLLATSEVMPSSNASTVTIGGEFAGDSCGGNAAWAQAADTWVSVQTRTGLWSVPLTVDHGNGAGCNFTHTTPRTGEFTWSLN